MDILYLPVVILASFVLLQQIFRAFLTFFGFTVVTLNNSYLRVHTANLFRMSNAVIGEAVYLELDVDFVRTFFQPINVIDNGMCGEVILAKPLEDLTRKCVVKKFSLLTETEDRSERNERIFKNEVKFMQGLRHPYIATSMLAVKCPGYLALSMDYYEGRTLNHHVGSISIEMAELCVIQVACALRYMHRNNLAHLDVKLENIFVDGEFNSILGDFGLSVVLSPEQQTLPRYKCGGTPCYFAPERKRRQSPDTELDPYKVSLTL